MKILILGGTGEGRALAEKLAVDHDIITSLAGATSSAAKIIGEVRIGGFGGEEGLVDYLLAENIDRLIDATHPFANQITDHAVQACKKTNIPFLRLDRPQWTLPTDAKVIFVPDSVEAARLVARTSSSVFLTIGQKYLKDFEALPSVKLLVRAIENFEENLKLENATYVSARPPFALADEIALMQNHQIDTLVSKASGGDATRAKLDAAAKIGARIILIRRPPPPNGDRVFRLEDAVNWISKTL
ncbi:MAG: precorrin-6A reductase [Rhodospirillaceae bacterium]|nr:MAG: precorrin-6A reductase [Rhodospirillaceae bacterium]